ncbi:MAG: DUF5615 family PIN-like protein [Nitrospinae bacterium]|nr:DUF5615 family PIN-like protein [Nitrospinota bacterium]
MRFLADECCDASIAEALRRAGHDVLAVKHLLPGAPDEDVIALAIRENRILLTEDKDFGQLVFASGKDNIGVIFLRYPHGARKRIIMEVTGLISEKGEKLSGVFVTAQPGKIRISGKPEK